MKNRYLFVLVLILTILFSIGSIAASENVTADLDDDSLSIDNANSQNSVSSHEVQPTCEENGNPSSDYAVDLSVYMELGETKRETFGINEITFDIPFIITVTASNGTARNVTIYHNISSDFKYITSDASAGTYDHAKGIWRIGDLTGNATLTIYTQLNTFENANRTYSIFVNSSMDSNDRNPNNNAVIFNIEVSSRIASNTTQTSANRGANHGPRQGSQEESPIREQDPTPDPTPDPEPEPNPQPDPNPDPTPDPNPDPTPDPNPDPNPDPEPDNGPGVKTTESFTSAVSDIFDYLGDIFSSDDENLSGDVVKAIAAQNYIKFPILVFAVFMFVILGSVVYDKIKI